MRPLSLTPLCLVLPLVGCPGKDSPLDTDTGVPWVDADGDGYSEQVDCDEADPQIHPGADEVCDGIDNDCDGFTDDDDADLIDGGTWWWDADKAARQIDN